jgi:cytochrome c oxidase subunit I
MATESERVWLLNPKMFLGTVDHKHIGMLYLMFASINAILAGLYILMVRIELFNPGLDDVVSPAAHLQFISTHGIVMIFFVIMATGAGMGNYLVPKMIGASDLYWPRWNNVAFWMLIPAAIFVYSAAFVRGSGVGWTFYPPLSMISPGVSLQIVGLLLAGTSSVIGGLNFLLTIFTMRRPGLTMRKLDLFSWSIIITSLIQFFATPIITVALVMILLSSAVGATFFTLNAGSSPILFQHVFWSYSHPAVYIMILPSMGLTSVLIARFSQNEIFGKMSMIISMAAIALLGFIVWGHHMFTVTFSTSPNWIFTFTTFLIAVPSGIKTFNWIFTMYNGKLKLDPPFLFSLGFVVGFVLGGVTGIMVNTLAIDYVYHDTYFVVGHFHFIIIGGALSTIMGAIYFMFHDMTGKLYNMKLAMIQFYFWIPGFILTFFGMNMLGVYGMPRRYVDYHGLDNLAMLTFWHRVTTIGAFLQAISFTLFFYNIIFSAIKGEKASGNVYNLAIPEFWEDESKEVTK